VDLKSTDSVCASVLRLPQQVIGLGSCQPWLAAARFAQ